MEKQSKIITEYIFNEKEFQLINQCLGYCNHRMTQHNSHKHPCGLRMAITLNALQKLREEIKHENKLIN